MSCSQQIQDSRSVQVTLPILYKTDVRGNLLFWRIFVEKDEYFVVRGVVGGKELMYPPTQVTAKNIGKSNETTPYEQALKEAYAKWEHKKEEGYAEEPAKCDKEQHTVCVLKDNEIVECETCDDFEIEEIDNDFWARHRALKTRPMLAYNYDDNKEKLRKPFGMSPKLDGIRCLSCLVDSGKTLMFSRNGKEFYYLLNIRKQLTWLFNQHPELMTDGELYTTKLTFNQISGIVRSKSINIEEDKLEYYIFDLVDKSKSYLERVKVMKSIEKELQKFYDKSLLIKFIYYETGSSDDDIAKYHQKVTINGIDSLGTVEGVILRNLQAPYENHRSYGLLKLKSMMDDEFTIVDFTEGTGTEAGAIIFICETKSKRFNVRPMGTFQERREMLKRGKKLIGKKLTVKFQEYSEFGIPRFPIGICVRDYE